MDSLSIGFWGAFFGAVGLVLLAGLLLFLRAARRVALTGALSALISGFYVLVFLGWLPLADPVLRMRLQAGTATVSAAVLGMLLFWMLGQLRGRRRAALAVAATSGLALALLVASWLLSPESALALGAAMEALMVVIALVGAVGHAVRGERLGWLAVAGVGLMSVTIAVLTRHALQPGRTAWQLHALAALSGMGYVTMMAAAMWERYSYLIGLREVMRLGPSFDPVTRMRSHAETGVMVGEAFARGGVDGLPLGVLVVSLGNLQALEQLHGRSAYNHGLFICAGRLRRTVPPGVEMGRLGEDAFLLLVRRPSNPRLLIDLAHQVARRLAKPVALGTSRDLAALEASHTEWVADIGVGVMVARPDMRPALAVNAARAMSRTAWSYASRVAWYDEKARQIAELPSGATHAVVR
ncbi:MAG TPA: GGDEF domain-containing protein [Ramlibacter sp.]|jgi:GGDEF domain-containing protein|uniref:GGDEF domain-containing protein n=1 Tax=Ramlibacter sp. TaxID=1917967 RepID=UPI002D2CB5FA|nr:GGDEF domain-containing protein [Ramlibacter sp.]HZY18428.1 GGDEF domain-containing protein [Ramlibacter sp.]